MSAALWGQVGTLGREGLIAASVSALSGPYASTSRLPLKALDPSPAWALWVPQKQVLV